MKLAVFDHISNPGGGGKFVENLLIAIKKIRPGYKITFYCSPIGLIREEYNNSVVSSGIKVIPLKSLKLVSNGIFGIKSTIKIFRKIQGKQFRFKNILPLIISGQVEKEIEKYCKNYDLAFFPWPFLLKNISTECPKIGVFHDFNYKYFFGTPTFLKNQIELLETEIPKWLDTTMPIVSSYFMADELKKFYPNAKYPVNVIHLAPIVKQIELEDSEANNIIKRLGVKKPYIVYPTHLCVHKNLNPLFSAISIIAEKGINLSLVITGAGSELIKGKACSIGIERGKGNINSFGLGYVSDIEMNALFKYATAVISPSLYEAGNGPGLDGWIRGTPVAMSNIPAFIEHFKILNIKAEIFDPRNPEDIAEKLIKIYKNFDKAKRDALYSQEQLKKYTWEMVAKKYIDVFEKTVKGNR